MRDIFETLADDKEKDPVAVTKSKMRDALPKRFYKTAAYAAEGTGFALQLDGKTVRTPGRQHVVVQSEAAAAALAAEWQAQGEQIDPATMPLTRLVNSIIDGVAAETEPVAAEIAKFAGTDLICYRAIAPERLAERQAARWDPVVAWAEQHLGVALKVTGGVMPVEQSPDVVASTLAHLPTDPFRLGALHSLTTIFGSVILALAAHERHLSVEEAFNLAHLDEDWNAELWGKDSEVEARRAYRWSEVAAAAVLLS